MSKFVHLHLHTEYSLADGLLRIEPLMQSVKEYGMPAVAVTDQMNLFALVKFYQAAINRGIKPIIGVDALIAGETAGDPPTRAVLLCQDARGYRHLTQLVTRAYLEGSRGAGPQLERAWLTELNGGLIALSGAREGDIGRALLAGNQPLARSQLEFWRQHFPGRYYLELQRTGRAEEESYLHAAVELAAASGTPVVATNAVRFLKPTDFEAHEARVCIHQGRTLTDPRRPRDYSDQQYLRTPEEMDELFSDIPEALENTIEIAKRCNLALTLGSNVLPEFPVPEGVTVEQYFAECSRAGLAVRLRMLSETGVIRDEKDDRNYGTRLETELKVIIEMGFAGYFLIVADFIRWARDNGVPVGPGRGSGAGSLVAYALEITDIDPLQYDLLFERFLNPERVSMPDFDIDFCMEGRDRVIEYVADRYGRERVSQIITYGRMAAKAAVRDVGRVLSHPYGFVDRIAKLIPFKPGVNITLDDALSQERDLREIYENEEEVRAIIDLARSLEGLARNAGKHAGGVVIAPERLTDYTPLYCEAGGGSVVTQLSKDDVEAIGLVKFDFLGLRTLTIIDRAVRTINAQLGQSGERHLDIGRIPLNDPAAYDLLKAKRTTAVFQLESYGIKELIGRLQPDNFEDVVALVALYRPGPLQSGMVDDFIDRKHGRARVDYPHPDLEPILQPTYGVIVYQEQVMQIAQVLAGYTLGGADLLRRAMGKKKPEEMAKQRAVFLAGAGERGVDQRTAVQIFDLMEKFAGYGFNKSHSVAYALLAYQTAWLKSHYPAAFMAAVLSADMDNTDKIVKLIDETRTLGLRILPPDVNRSLFAFTVVDDKTILYGLGAIKGVGQAAVEGLVESREAEGVFDSLDTLCRRGGAQRLNRRVIEALIRAGAMDSIGPNRATLMAHLPVALKQAEQRSRDVSAGQVDLFGRAAAPALSDGIEPKPEWDDDQRLSAEKETLGLYLTGHPITRFEDELVRITTQRIGDLAADGLDAGPGFNTRREQSAVLAGLIVTIRTRNTQSGRSAFLTLDDRSGRIEVKVFGEHYRRYSGLLIRDKLLVAEGSLGVDEFNGQLSLRANRLFDIDQARAHYAKQIEIRLKSLRASNGLIEHLQAVLEPFREGRCPVIIDYASGKARARLTLNDHWRVMPTEELLQRLSELSGVEQADVRYSRSADAAPAVSAD